jgi:hypothetical protein
VEGLRWNKRLRNVGWDFVQRTEDTEVSIQIEVIALTYMSWWDSIEKTLRDAIDRWTSVMPMAAIR